jgi:hypothetical protein
MTTAPKKEDKPKYYFGCVPKEELTPFMERLKKALTEGQKSGDKKNLNIEIRGSNEEPKGISLEVFTLDKTKFGEFFDPNADHTKKALVVTTVNFEVKEEKDVETIKTAFEQVKPMILGLPPIQAKKDKFELHFRNNGTKIAVDFISVEGKLIQPLLDLGVDLSEYNKFYFGLKTGADLGKIYTEGGNPSDELISEIFNVLLKIDSSGENVKYLSTALIAAFKDVKLADEKKQKKLQKFLGFLNLVNVFIGAKLKFEYDAKVLKGAGDKAVEKLEGGQEGFKKQLSGYHDMAKNAGASVAKPAIEGMGFGGALKALNLDSFSVAGGVPKYSNGLALVLRIPGLTKVVEEILK